jgi:hypothetical protein
MRSSRHTMQYFTEGKFRSLCLPLAVLMSVTVGADFACGKAEKETPVTTPKNKVEGSGKEKIKLFGRIDKLSAACAAAGVLLESRQMPTRILKVRLGSPASYAGLSVDDQVTAGTISGETMKLSIERNGQIYQVNLKVEPENAQRVLADWLWASTNMLWRLPEFPIGVFSVSIKLPSC